MRQTDEARRLVRTLASVLDPEREPPEPSTRAWFAAHLDVDESDCVELVEQVAGWDALVLQVGLTRLLRQEPPVLLASCDGRGERPSWAVIADGEEPVVAGMRAVWKQLPGHTVPVGVRLQQSGEQQFNLIVFAPASVVETARRMLDRALEGAVEAGRLPLQGRVLSVSFSHAGERLDLIELPRPDRVQLSLPAEVWAAVDRDVHGTLGKAALLERLGLGLDVGLLLHGPPGTGKTELVRMIAAEVAGVATVLIPTPAVARDRLHNVYALAERLRPSLVVLEDLDLLLGGRRAGSNLAEFLTAVDGTTTRHRGVLTLATTNAIDALDPAVLRSARLGIQLAIPLPDRAARELILARLLEPIDPEGDLAQLADATVGMSGADLRELVRTAALMDQLDPDGLRRIAGERTETETTGHYL